MLGGPVALLYLGERLGKLGLRESGLGVVWSHLDGDGEQGITRLGGAIAPPPSCCLFLAFLASSASENSLSDVGSHFTVFEVPNFPAGLP